MVLVKNEVLERALRILEGKYGATHIKIAMALDGLATPRNARRNANEGGRETVRTALFASSLSCRQWGCGGYERVSHFQYRSEARLATFENVRKHP